MLKLLSRKQLAAGQKLRVLVVDDSVVIRRLVTHALAEDPAIEVVGAAADGEIALQKIAQLKPDAITLDVEMPRLNGIDTVKRIRKEESELCVIMFSTLTERGAASTLEALTAGANDYVTKAAYVGSLDVSMASLRSELLPKIKQFFLFGNEAKVAPVASVPRVVQAFRGPRPKREVLVIGVSTGGPNALAAIVPQIPNDFRLPVLIVQHMPPMFTRLLAERLQTLTRLKVREAAAGMPVEPGNIFVAPGDYHLKVRRLGTGVFTQIDQTQPENSCRPAVDVLFRSAAEVYGGGTIAAVLTGMGQDGLRGTEELRPKGAFVIAQDEATSVVWGMPGFVAKAGLADCVVPLDAVVSEIVRQAA